MKYSKSRNQILAGNSRWKEHPRRLREWIISEPCACLIHLTRHVANNGGPTYDANYLSELKASTPTSRPPQSQYDYDADTSVALEMTMDDIPMEVDGKWHEFITLIALVHS